MTEREREALFQEWLDRLAGVSKLRAKKDKGKSLNPRERKEWERFTDSLSAAENGIDPDAATIPIVAGLFGYSDRQVKRHVQDWSIRRVGRDGMPLGEYCRAFRSWMERNIAEAAPEKTKAAAELAARRQELIAVQTEIARYKHDLQRGNVIYREDHETILREIVQAFDETAQVLKGQLVAMGGKTRIERQKKADNILTEWRKQFAAQKKGD